MIGSDIDRESFSTYVANGFLEIPEQVSIYVSKKDKALGISEWLTRRAPVDNCA